LTKSGWSRREKKNFWVEISEKQFEMISIIPIKGGEIKLLRALKLSYLVNPYGVELTFFSV